MVLIELFSTSGVLCLSLFAVFCCSSQTFQIIKKIHICYFYEYVLAFCFVAYYNDGCFVYFSTGPAADEVINVTAELPYDFNNTQCRYPYGCDPVQILTCVHFTASPTVFPTSRSVFLQSTVSCLVYHIFPGTCVSHAFWYGLQIRMNNVKIVGLQIYKPVLPIVKLGNDQPKMLF